MPVWGGDRSALGGGNPPRWVGDWLRCTPVYETYAGWQEDLGGVRQFSDLPMAAQVYVRAIQDILETPIEVISVGAERERFIPLEAGIPVAV